MEETAVTEYTLLMHLLGKKSQLFPHPHYKCKYPAVPATVTNYLLNYSIYLFQSSLMRQILQLLTSSDRAPYSISDLKMLFYVCSNKHGEASTHQHSYLLSLALLLL